MYINRSLENRVEYMADHFPVVMVSGARQVGKRRSGTVSSTIQCSGDH